VARLSQELDENVLSLVVQGFFLDPLPGLRQRRLPPPGGTMRSDGLLPSLAVPTSEAIPPSVHPVFELVAPDEMHAGEEGSSVLGEGLVERAPIHGVPDRKNVHDDFLGDGKVVSPGP
jgi:hypothetical protein